MNVFWDTNLFIYLIERHPDYYPKVLSLYESHIAARDKVLTSTLTLGELLAQPLRHGRRELAAQYTSLLTSTPGVELIPFDTRAAGLYGEIRATTTLRQPDAMQLACAIAGGAGVFVTNDQSLWRLTVPGLQEIRGL